MLTTKRSQKYELACKQPPSKGGKNLLSGVRHCEIKNSVSEVLFLVTRLLSASPTRLAG